MRAIKLKDSGGEKPPKSVAHLLCNVKPGKSLSQLLLCVPRREKIYSTREKHCLDDSKECPDNKQLFVSLHCRCSS